MARKAQDPLLAALIAKLPPSGDDWPVERQLAWLKLMAMAFGTVYGGDVVGALGKPGVALLQQTAPKPPKPVHQYIINKSGFVVDAKGKRLLPGDIAGPIFDERGEDGDLRAIVWADDSRGLNGADLTIHA